MVQGNEPDNPEAVTMYTCNSILDLTNFGKDLSVSQVEELMGLVTRLFRSLMIDRGFDPRDVQGVITKFRDAGRRSPPWRPTSSVMPGLPQDGADGNRRNRWEFENDHRFYADRITANLVEIKYYLEALSMDNAPVVPHQDFPDAWSWLVDHRVEPGAYQDPIQLIPIDLEVFASERRHVESGHLVPLDRGGRHVPENAYLMLTESNRLQGNLTLQELLALMKGVLQRHRIFTS